jgi:hypothetical protein
MDELSEYSEFEEGDAGRFIGIHGKEGGVAVIYPKYTFILSPAKEQKLVSNVDRESGRVSASHK